MADPAVRHLLAAVILSIRRMLQSAEAFDRGGIGRHGGSGYIADDQGRLQDVQ